jgi:hypothetical protein
LDVLAREVEVLRGTLRGWADAARRLWLARPGLVRTAAIAFAAGAAITGGAALVAQARLPGRLPAPRDWAALGTLVEGDARPGDAVALSPAWAERAREILPASVPVLAHGRWGGEDLLGVRRVWLVSLPRAPGFSPQADSELLRRVPRPGAPVRLGELEVTRLELSPPLIPLAFLPDRLAPAQGARASAVREVREIAGVPRPCLVAGEGDAPLALTLPFEPVRVGRFVRGHVGSLDAAALPAPVRIALRVGGEEAGVAEVSGAGFVPFQIDTARFTGRLLPVSLILTTLGGGARLCLDAATLP